MLISKCKFFFITVIILFGFNIELNAQVSLGLQGGINFSTIVTANKIAQPTIFTKRDFTVGGIINFKITRIFSIQSEIRYAQLGNKQILDGAETFIDHLNYLEIPVYAVAELPCPIISPFILSGINTGFLLNAFDEHFSHQHELISYINRSNFSLDMGGGIKHSVYNNFTIQLTGYYSYGIYNIRKVLSERNTRNFQMLLGVLYDI